MRTHDDLSSPKLPTALPASFYLNDLVSVLLPQLFGDGIRNALLEEHRRVDGAHVAHARSDAEPRRIEGSLWSVSSKNVEEHLHLSLWLHVATHDTVREEELRFPVFALLCRHGGDNGMVRAFARCDAVGMGWIHLEVAAAVLKCKAATLGHDA